MGKVVVIVDDEKDFCELLARALQLRNGELEVHQAHTGLEGLETIRRLKPDLVVLDIKMPRMNGYEVLNSMRADKRLKEVPVMMLTSLTEGGVKSDEAWAQSLEVQAFVTKPLELEVIVQKIETLLKIPQHSRAAETAAE